jgi:phospholipid-binding lipoprotein MlaA
MTTMRRILQVAVLLAASTLVGCASVKAPSSSQMAASSGPTAIRADPWERFNRAVFAFNELIDVAVIKPVAQGYQRVVPRLVRVGVDNVIGNLTDFWSAANLVLQLKPQAALEMGMRVATNTVFGLAGLLDFADEVGLERRSVEDLGQTLGRWGIQTGPYLVLPVLGPSTVRDGVARLVDARYAPPRLAFHEDADIYGAAALQAVSMRVRLLNAGRLLDDIALDKYVFVRDAYLSRRRSLIYDGEPPDEPAPADTPPKPSPAEAPDKPKVGEASDKPKVGDAADKPKPAQASNGATLAEASEPSSGDAPGKPTP